MDILKAALFAFLPIACLTHVIAYYSYRNGSVSIHEDKQDEWDVAGNQKYRKKSNKNKKLQESKASEDDTEMEEPLTNNYLHQKWVSFGGGFYGLMALITFVVIEAQEVMAFVQRIEGWHTLTEMLNVDSLVDLIIASVMNMVDAFVWFKYWPDSINIGNGWVWLGMAYGGYYAGRWLAELRLDSQTT